MSDIDGTGITAGVTLIIDGTGHRAQVFACSDGLLRVMLPIHRAGIGSRIELLPVIRDARAEDVPAWVDGQAIILSSTMGSGDADAVFYWSDAMRGWLAGAGPGSDYSDPAAQAAGQRAATEQIAKLSWL